MGQTGPGSTGVPSACGLKAKCRNVEKTDVKGIEKLTSIRLAELLSQKDVVPTDAITEALYTQDHLGEPFVEVIVSTGHITEWDLTKLVVEHFQLPFIMASNYEIGDEIRDRLPKEFLFTNQIVPLDAFGDVVNVVMPILTSFEVLEQIRQQCKGNVFPYVGLISENKRVLQQLFPDYKEWQVEREASREKRRRGAKGAEKAQGDWTNIFDNADAAVRDSLSQ